MGGIIGFSVGNALGVPVEFLSRDRLKKRPVSEMIEYGSHNVSKVRIFSVMQNIKFMN